MWTALYRKPDEEDEDQISEGMVPPFYAYLSKLGQDCQVIVIENDEPPLDVTQLAAYTHFTRNTSFGRYGFLLNKDTSP